jgi:hypothetical protein
MMTLLNDPWREVERKERRRRIERGIAWLFQALVWVGLGLALGYALTHK